MILFLFVAALTTTGFQQHDHAAMPQAGTGGTASLSAQQVAQLLAGEGMSLAKPAELNHYPGPRHVLELRQELRLTDQQIPQVEAEFATMLNAAKGLGARIVDAERALDAAFRGERVDEKSLRELTAASARLHGELRAVHLSAHLATRRLLTPEQVRHYDVLRGYGK